MKYGQLLDSNSHFEILTAVKENPKKAFLWQNTEDGKKQIVKVSSLAVSSFGKNFRFLSKRK